MPVKVKSKKKVKSKAEFINFHYAKRKMITISGNTFVLPGIVPLKLQLKALIN